VERVERTAEETGLLAGDDCHGGRVRKGGRGVERFLWRLPLPLLGREQRRQA